MEAGAFSVSLGDSVAHNGATVVEGASLSVATPPQQWAYAVEFPLPPGRAFVGPLAITAKLRVTEGVVGLGCVNPAGEILTELEIEAGEAGPAQLRVPEGAICKSILLRNVSDKNSSSRVVVDELMVVDGEPKLPEVLVDAAPFAQFKPWSGIAPAGYWMDWLGTRTNADVWAFEPHIRALYARERCEQQTVPTDTEHVLDWAPLIDAVVSAGARFTAVALGAGWGRWLVAGAAAATQTGRDFRIVGVEAEPTHFVWLERHLRDNEIDPARATLICAAASGHNGLCWFQTGDATAWYGQSIVTDAQAPAAPRDVPIGATVEVDGIRLERTSSVDLRALAEGLDVIDYMHMDIQGSEADFLEAHPDVLDAQVRIVNIGTHSSEIERRLRRLFGRLGWVSVYDVPLRSDALVRVGEGAAMRVSFGDGVQVWCNPALQSPAQV